MATRALLTVLSCLACMATAAFAASPTALNPRDYGVLFNGADDTLGWQAAIADATATGLPIAAPCGTSTVTGRLTVSGPLTFAGGGMDCTILKFPTPHAYLLLVTPPQAPTVRAFSIYCTRPPQMQYG